MGNTGKLRRVEDKLIKEVRQTNVPFLQLAKKYGVSRQTIFNFCQRKRIMRPRRKHPERCSICQDLLRIARKPHSDFISSQTIKGKLRIGPSKWQYHIRILRESGLISQKFGRLQSRRAEMAYQIYFKKRIPVSVIGWRLGFKNFQSVIQKHKALGWNVPAPLFTYDSDDRRKAVLKTIKKKRSG
jgi:hypothetical protein